MGSHAAFVSAQVKGGLQVVNVEDDFIATDGEQINMVKIREQKPDFKSVVANGSIGTSASGERSRKLISQACAEVLSAVNFKLFFYS